MGEISNLEKETIQFFSVVGAAAIFGYVIPFTVAPFNALFRTVYDKTHGNEGKIRELYKKNLYRALAQT